LSAAIAAAFVVTSHGAAFSLSGGSLPHRFPTVSDERDANKPARSVPQIVDFRSNLF
jgi:hypothetical protein